MGKRILIDVRSIGEFKNDFVEGSVNIPIDRIPISIEELKKLELKGELEFCCASGNRSGQVVEYLKAQGLKNINNVGSCLNHR